MATPDAHRLATCDLMAKYAPLFRHLVAADAGPIEMTFEEIERLVGPLPASASETQRMVEQRAARHPHLQALAWLNAGRLVERVDRDGRRVGFSAVAGVEARRQPAGARTSSERASVGEAQSDPRRERPRRSRVVVTQRCEAPVRHLSNGCSVVRSLIAATAYGTGRGRAPPRRPPR